MPASCPLTSTTSTMACVAPWSQLDSSDPVLQALDKKEDILEWHACLVT